MNKNFSQKCGIACEFISFVNREDFRQEFMIKANENELSEECREFLNLCCDNEERFYEILNESKIPDKIKKFIR